MREVFFKGVMMTEVIITILVLLVLAVLVMLGVVINSISATRRELGAGAVRMGMVEEQLASVKESQDKQAERMDSNLRQGQEHISKYLQSSQDLLGKLNNQLGQLQSSSRQMVQLGDEVRKLHDIFKNPKHRGQLGELSLERLLEDVLPGGAYSIQHRFRSNKVVDAVVQMPDHIVPIDAKFPLPSFEAVINSQSDEERQKNRRQFQRDVAAHIDKIAANYILPDEGTLDFAFMYIPAENVYYETVVNFAGDKADLLNYALEKRVIPVSPNLLYAYLMTVVMGLRGLQIEKEAVEIRRTLGRLGNEFAGFVDTWNILGRHLRNASGQYDEGQKKVDRFDMALNQLTAEKEPELFE